MNSMQHGSLPSVMCGKHCRPRKHIALGKRESPPEFSVGYVQFQSKLGLGSPAFHEIVNPRPDSVPDGVGVVSLSPAIPPVALRTHDSLLAIICCYMSCHAAAVARFSIYLLAACRVNVDARFCEFLAVIFESGMCADSAWALLTLSGTP